MARFDATIAALGLALAWAGLVPAAQGAERGLNYIVPVAAGSTDVPANRQQMPDVLFADGSSLLVHLNRYRGAVVLVNFWSPLVPASVKEMLFLDRLQGDMLVQKEPLLVVPVNEDQGGIPGAKAFFAHQKITFLKPAADPGGAMAQALAVRGLPSSILIDKHGRVVTSVEGPYEWDSPVIVARIRQVMAEP